MCLIYEVDAEMVYHSELSLWINIISFYHKHFLDWSRYPRQQLVKVYLVEVQGEPFGYSLTSLLQVAVAILSLHMHNCWRTIHSARRHWSLKDTIGA
jgi:hypothetical protein